MLRLVIIVTFIFSFIAFATNLPSLSSQNILSGYFLNIIALIGKHIYLSLFLFLLASYIVFRSINFEKKHPKKHHAAIIFSQTLFVFITGVFFSFILLMFIAILQLNAFAYIVDLNPKILGIQTDVKLINSTLLNQGIPPSITSTNGDHYQELTEIAKATSGTNSFYGKYILSSIPSFLVIPAGKIGSTILIDKSLIISDINKKELEQLTPVVCYLFIKDYFPDRNIKHFPTYSIMNTNEYTKFRLDDYAGKFKIISKQLTNTQALIASISATIKKTQDDITGNQNLVQNTYAQKDKIYNKCMAGGYYQNSGSNSAQFIHTNTKQYCQLQVTEFDTKVQSANDQVDKLTRDLNKDNALLKSYQTLLSFLKAESDLTDSLKSNIPYELGLFVPENSIKIVLNGNTPHGVVNYFETATHEYLHYASHINNKNPLTLGLFEEGLTEYFAKNIIKDNLNSNTDLGYPVYTIIISQITKLIPESELADYYFNKDEKGLETALNRVYGDNFYNDNLILFETLQYAPDNKQLLQVANKIMAKIGGKTLKESDLISSGDL